MSGQLLGTHLTCFWQLQGPKHIVIQVASLTSVLLLEQTNGRSQAVDKASRKKGKVLVDDLPCVVSCGTWLLRKVGQVCFGAAACHNLTCTAS